MSIDFSLNGINLEFIKLYQAEKIRNVLIKYPESKIAIFDKFVLNIINPIFSTLEFKKFNVEELSYTNSFNKYFGNFKENGGIKNKKYKI